MGLIKEYVSREVVTDSNFVYNTGYRSILNGNVVEKVYYDTTLIGIIENKECVVLPNEFCGKKLVCVYPLKVYDICERLKLEKNKITKIPIKDKPKTWHTFEGTLPDSDYLTETLNTIKKVILDNTSLETGCFKNGLLESATFNKTPPVIPQECFAGCKNLKSCVLTNGVKKIGFKAFEGCSALKNIDLPNSITNICERAFCSTGIEYVVLPKEISRIKKLSFGNCVNLQMVIIPPSVNFIHPSAFKGSLNVILVSCENSYIKRFAYKNSIPFISLESLFNRDGI